MTTFHAKLGSVSSGTMRSEDLIPVFIEALDDIREAISLDNSIPETDRVATVSRLDIMLGEIEQRMNAEDYFATDEADHDLENLTDLLNEFAPPYAYFGSHEGDGADYGFWVSWECLEEDCEDGTVLKVDAGTDWRWYRLLGEYNLPLDTPLGILADRLEDDGLDEADTIRALEGAQYVLEVTDHGNGTLYALDGSEVWSCV